MRPPDLWRGHLDHHRPGHLLVAAAPGTRARLLRVVGGLRLREGQGESMYIPGGAKRPKKCLRIEYLKSCSSYTMHCSRDTTERPKVMC